MLLPVLLAAALSAVPEAAPLTVIVGATLVDGGGRAPVADSIVVLRGAAIAAVGDRVRTPIPKGALLIDGRRLWVAPAPATAVPAAALLPAIAEILGGPEARVRSGLPAHVALLEGDPRTGASSKDAKPRVRRLWIAGKASGP
jgi:hypothetical protein